MKAQSSMHKRLFSVRDQESKPEVARAATCSFEQTLLELVTAPLAPGEMAAAGYDRKEREIGKLFGTLGPVEAWTLHRRLANPLAEDPLATTFARMIPQRRLRLLAFLGDPKRRAALARSRAG
jgi:hypothetical protein